MGYSVYVVCRNRKLKNLMYSFMQKQTWLARRRICIVKDSQLSYKIKNKKHLIGFDISASDISNWIVKWMALKVSVRFRKNSKFPCYYYDYDKNILKFHTAEELINYIKNHEDLRKKDFYFPYSRDSIKKIVYVLRKLENAWVNEK